MSEYRIELKTLPSDEGGGYVAWVPDLPGCMSDGASVQEAISNCRGAIGEWIDHALRQGQPVPEPSSGVRIVDHV